MSGKVSRITVSGPAENLNGKSVNMNVGAMIAEVTGSMILDENNKITGYGYAAALSLGMPASATISESNSGKFGFRDIIDVILKEISIKLGSHYPKNDYSDPNKVNSPQDNTNSDNNSKKNNQPRGPSEAPEQIYCIRIDTNTCL